MQINQPLLQILYSFSHILNLINTKQLLSSIVTQLLTKPPSHLRFMPSVFLGSGYKKHPCKQSLRAFCKRTVESTVHYVIQCPLNKKAHAKFSAKKKFVSFVCFPSSEENCIITSLFASTLQNFRGKFSAQMQ